jgi:hypothetical protein
MSKLLRAVQLPVIQHPRVPSSTSLANIHGSCHELLLMTVVTLTCMPRFHTSQEWGMVWCIEVIASLLLQTFLRPSLVKPLGTHDLQPQFVRVSASYLYSSLGMTLHLLSCLEYGVLLLQPHRWCQDQIWLSLLAQSNWMVYNIDIHIELQTVPSSDSLGSYCCMRTQPIANSYPNYQDIPSRKLWAYLLEFDLLAQFGHPFVGDRPNCESSESQGMHAVAPKSERQTATLNQRRSSLKLRADITHEWCRSQHTSQLCIWCWQIWSEQIWWVIQRPPKLSQTCGQKQAFVRGQLWHPWLSKIDEG